ncbi:transcription initiation factor IID, 18kD subunit-domain-containing protein [Halteromyces radiatus]|uniref:transcription initiation factor IID, 18kD subunit-domain-containing protein n=1 Tax=Halteromyces radiatus TaxID=101107 RepID=UPI002220195D|nr:transcription initiation factor IID, 18kD subunit-domain-containing protein [Halteromyces radiatus]KAI8078802.1 transcription initiation factor IID, 18kD subunit-domain-containing protein [Halteromyces radiatus]
MMFVFGEVSDPLPETTTLVEDIIRSQVIEIVIQASAQASRRNSRYLSAEDLIFLMRHDRAKVNRLRSFLSWKDVRKNTKDGSGDPVEDMMEDTSAGKLHRSIIKLPWELVNQFSDMIIKPSNPEEESDDEDELEAYNDSIQRLRHADEVTRAMTREEYVHYSECRQASFTYRKSKRFREWANVSAFVEVKPNDDIIDSLGFLTYEMVSKLTSMALQIKRDLMEADGKKEEEAISLGMKRKRKDEEEDDSGDSGEKKKKKNDEQQQQLNQPDDQTPNNNNETTESTTESIVETQDSKEKKDEDENNGLFSLPTTEQTPLLPEHIHEAFRRLQQSPQPIKNFRGGLVRTRISLI